jgi:hypothetical protein
MTATPKKKLCWNCEGRVSLAEENCPYCAVYLGPAPDENGESKDILAPPYRLVESEEETVPASPYASEKEEEKEEVDLSAAKTDIKEVVLPLSLLSAGTLFFLFGLVLLVFSNQGVLTLTWNGDYWYFYLISAVPMLFFGWRSLKRFEVENQPENLTLAPTPISKIKETQGDLFSR